MITIAICDDDEKQIEIMNELVSDVFNKFNVPYKIHRCSNGADLLYIHESVGNLDLVLLDINLEYDNGIDAAKELRKTNSHCYIVFVSASKQYYKAAFSVQPYQFIDKPIDPNEFSNIITEVANLIIAKNQILSFEYKWKQYRICLNDILYIESSHRLIHIYTADENIYKFYGQINQLEENIKLKSKLFLRIHKSFLINMSYIKEIGSDYIIMFDNKRFEISSRKRKDVSKAYGEFVSVEDSNSARIE